MKRVSPESIGLNSENIEKYIKKLENKRLATHNIIMAKGNKIFFEKYWSPFNEDFMHRMYSVSKSFVSLAIGFLLQDNKINLDDTMDMYFSDELQKQPDINMHKQTIQDMLMMQTAKPNRYWFDYAPEDRVEFYFENDREESRPGGTIFSYDSDASFILAALVERILNKPFMQYLYEKLFIHIGVSKEAYCLKCPGGHSWGDSGVICTPLDLLKIARFILNGGAWNGKQILNSEYITFATTPKVFNNYTDIDNFNTQGYGFQIWGTYRNAFFLNGMGCQFAVCIPDKDMILIYNGDNQGKEVVRNCIVDEFFSLIVDAVDDGTIEEEATITNIYLANNDNFNLISAQGLKHSKYEKEINNVEYILDENPMGIKKFKITLNENEGNIEYFNEQGRKELLFGLCENLISKFPQEGYSDEVGTIKTQNFYYRCAASAAWVEPQKLFIKVQIIDKYFGNMSITIGFKDDVCGLYMEKHAENFLDEYQGFAGGKRKEKS